MRLFLWDQMERFDLVPACQIPSRSTVSPIHMHTASKQPGTMQNTPKVGGREKSDGEQDVEGRCACNASKGWKREGHGETDLQGQSSRTK